MSSPCYTNFQSRFLFRTVNNLIENRGTKMVGYCRFDREVKTILDVLYNHLTSDCYITFWCKFNICYNLICIKNYMYEKFLEDTPCFFSKKVTDFENEYDMQRVAWLCENETFLFRIFLHANFYFYELFANMYNLSDKDVSELVEFFNAFLDIKTLSNVLLLNIL